MMKMHMPLEGLLDWRDLCSLSLSLFIHASYMLASVPLLLDGGGEGV